jgi:DNA polymerase-3 subunit delta
MAAPTLSSILKDIKAGKFAPVYLLHGEEAFFVEQIADAIEAKALTESEKVFNQTVCYGKDSDARSIIDNVHSRCARRSCNRTPRSRG